MTIANLDAQMSVGELVRERPGRARVFEQFSIDYCCGGKLPLAEACKAKGLEIDEIMNHIQLADTVAATAENDSNAVDPDAMTLTELADHIVQTHHSYVQSELPRLNQMTERVFRVHGDKEPRLADVRRAFLAIQAELLSHMVKEEEILFPMIRKLERGDGAVASHCGSVANPIRQMEIEHADAGDALEIMSTATDGYQPPEWACNTYRAMLDGLQAFEKDLHQHIHKENNVLFPKAITLESELATQIS